MLYSVQILFLVLMFCVKAFSASPIVETQQDRNQLSVFDIPHPRCESRTIIETGKNSFMTIANDLPGRNEYNELIRTFRKEQWGKLDASIEIFENVFEDSPLREAVAFLRAESLFDRISNPDSPQVKEAEKNLREVLLLYPKSKLVPVIQATAGAFWLRSGQYPKSLAIFIKAKEDYPFHPLNCLFQFGIGENNFLLNEHEAALKSFKMVTQKCQNPRLVTGARLRMIELDNKDFSKSNGQKLHQLYDRESNIISRFYPEALYNLGEFKYKNREYNSSQFFFSEYLANKNKDPQCAPFASKRLGDIAFKTRKPQAEVIGMYLQTHDQFPKTEIGKYAYVQALLLDYNTHKLAEQQRRTAIVDEVISSMADEKLRYLAALSKGLAVLDSGGKGIVDYLAKLTKTKPDDLKTEEMSEFIASRVFKVLQKESKDANALDFKKESMKDEELFTPIESVFSQWIKGTSFEKSTRELYTGLVMSRFNELLGKEKWDLAFELIENWKSSELWPGEAIDPKIKRDVGLKIITRLMSEDEEDIEDLTVALSKNKEGISSFVGADFFPIFVVVSLNQKNLTELENWLKKTTGNRKISKIDTKIPAEIRDFMVVERARGYLELKQFKESEELAKTISTKEFRDQAVEIRLESLRGQKNYKQAFQLGMTLGTKVIRPDSKKRVLASLVSDLSESKLWNQSEKLLKEARQGKIQGKELAPFLYLSGKSNVEQKKCKDVISYYSQALKADPTHLSATEAKFRMGKCYQQQRKKDLAKKQWQEVADSQDPFWGPLAKSEINLMEGP